MPKAPTITKLPKGLKGTKVPTHRLNTKTGRLEPIRKKLSSPAKYAQRTRQKWRAAR